MVSDIPWHWLVLPAAVFLLIGLPLIAVRRENSGATTDQTRFMLWSVLIYAPGIVMANCDDILVQAGCVVAFVAGSYPFQQALTRRAREAGYSKAIAYWSVLPGVNTLIAGALIAAPPGFAASRQLTSHVAAARP